MDNKENITPDEHKADEEALKEVKEDEVREAVISDFGFDEEEDAEKIGKLVEERMESKKSLSTAIRQKIKHRDKPSTPEETTEQKEARETEEARAKKETEGKKSTAEIVQETLEQRDLDDLDYPDELKDEIKRIAQVQQISVKKVLEDPYIVSRTEAHKETVETEEAAISRTNKTGGKVTYSVDKPPEVDMDTEEGRKDWDDYLGWLGKQPGYTSQDSQL